jgi:hypothetical protein
MEHIRGLDSKDAFAAGVRGRHVDAVLCLTCRAMHIWLAMNDGPRWAVQHSRLTGHPDRYRATRVRLVIEREAS